MKTYYSQIKVDDLTFEKVEEYLKGKSNNEIILGNGRFYTFVSDPFDDASDKRIRTEPRANILSIGPNVPAEVKSKIQKMTKKKII